MIFINCLRQYNEIHVITKPSSSTCQVCVSAVRGGLLAVLYGNCISGGVGQGPERHVTETALPTIGMQLTKHR